MCEWCNTTVYCGCPKPEDSITKCGCEKGVNCAVCGHSPRKEEKEKPEEK